LGPGQGEGTHGGGLAGPEIEAANASGNTPVVFVHGLWLLPSSWDSWVQLFSGAGYAPLTPDWPDDPETVGQARANREVFAKKTLKQIADHTTEIIKALDKKPAVLGHSTGGLLAQTLAGRGLSAATVAIDPGVSAAFCLYRSPRLGWRARSWSTRSRAAARSR
jgi:non-heme chloroperoxidase